MHGYARLSMCTSSSLARSSKRGLEWERFSQDANSGFHLRDCHAAYQLGLRGESALAGATACEPIDGCTGLESK